MAYMLIFLLKKMWVAFANAKATHIFFSKYTWSPHYTDFHDNPSIILPEIGVTAMLLKDRKYKNLSILSEIDDQLH